MSPTNCKEQWSIRTALAELHTSSLIHSAIASFVKPKPNPNSRLERNQLYSYNGEDMEDWGGDRNTWMLVVLTDSSSFKYLWTSISEPKKSFGRCFLSPLQAANEPMPNIKERIKQKRERTSSLAFKQASPIQSNSPKTFHMLLSHTWIQICHNLYIVILAAEAW